MEIVIAAVPPFMKNGFVVSCEVTRETVVIDPGDEVGELIAAVRASRLNPRAILLTHAHFDHITGVGQAKAALKVPVWLHRDDLFLYDDIAAQAALFGLHAQRQPPVDRLYTPGVPFAFGDYVVDIPSTPGHSPGGVCLAIGPASSSVRELFVGDTLFAGSIGRTDLAGCDHETLIESITTVLFAYPDETIVHPGHGPDTTIGREREGNPYL